MSRKSFRLALTLSLLAVPTAAQVFPPTEIWVQQGDAIPELDQRVWPSFGHVAGDRVAFPGTDTEVTGFGMFLADRDGVTDLVGDRFFQFAGPPSFDGDWLAFDAVADFESDVEPGGVHLYADGVLTRILDWGAPIPGRPGLVLGTVLALSVDDGRLVVAVHGFGDGDARGGAILLYTEAGGFEALVTDATPVPGAGGLSFLSFTDVALSDGVVYFRAFYPGASEDLAADGIFAIRDGAVERVAVEGDPLPGGEPGEAFEDFPQETKLSASGGAVAFRADGDMGTRGIFWNVGGGVELVVSHRTKVPGGGGGGFRELGQVALSGDELVFEGDGVNANANVTELDLYLVRNGQLTRLIDAHCDDRLITRESFRDGKLAYLRNSEVPSRLRIAYLENPAPAGETYTDPAFPDFRFTVRISAGGQTIPTRDEPECQADALCIGGALEGRAEVTLRVLGPRDNGFFWPALGRLTPSRVEVWIEQVSSGIVRYYLMEELPREVAELPGLIDRRGFPVTP